MLSVCVCVFVCVNVERGSFQRRGPFFYYVIMRIGILVCDPFMMHSFFCQYEQNCKQTDQNTLWIDSKLKMTRGVHCLHDPVFSPLVQICFVLLMSSC